MGIRTALQNFSKGVPKQISRFTGKTRPSTASHASTHSTASSSSHQLATNYSVQSSAERERRDEYDRGHRSHSLNPQDLRSNARQPLFGHFSDVKSKSFPASARPAAHPHVYSHPMDVNSAYNQHVAEHERDGYDPLHFGEFKEKFLREQAHYAKPKKPVFRQVSQMQIADAERIVKMGKPAIPYSRWYEACKQAVDDGYDEPSLGNFLERDHEYTNDMHKYQQATKLVKSLQEQAIWNPPAKQTPLSHEIAEAKEIVARGRPGDVHAEYDNVVQQCERDGYDPPSFGDFAREHRDKEVQFKKAQKTLETANSFATSRPGPARQSSPSSLSFGSGLSDLDKSRLNRFAQGGHLAPARYQHVVRQAELTFERILNSPPSVRENRLDKDRALKMLETALQKGDFESLGMRTARLTSFLDADAARMRRM